MCKWGTSTVVRCPAGFSGKHKERVDVPVDSCISDLVEVLNEGGVLTIACCCGHGKGEGRIDLLDGRVLFIDNARRQKEGADPQCQS